MLILVDDDELFRSALAANLREDGYEVLDYESCRCVPLDGRRAVEALLIDQLIDQGVGGEDGVRFAERFHQALPSVPIVIMAAFVPFQPPNQGAPPAYLTWLSKPLDYEELLAVLDKVGGR